MKTTLGLLTGIALGIGIGVLLAPDKGSETRKKLADSTGDLFEKLKNFLSPGENVEGTSPKKHFARGTSNKSPQTSNT